MCDYAWWKNTARILIPFSNDTVMWCTESTSEDIKELQPRIICSPKFAFQIYKSTDVARLAQLLVYFRYCFEKKTFRKSSCSVYCFQKCTGSAISKAVNNYFTNEQISWENWIEMCAERAAVKQERLSNWNIANYSHMNSAHCVIHKASGIMGPWTKIEFYAERQWKSWTL
jgi:hypothetical protein